MINTLLKDMYNKNIQIIKKDYKTSLVYEKGTLDSVLKNEIKKHKKMLVKRLDENEAAKKVGFIVYDHGELYEYRYGMGAFLYIERLPNDRATAWRVNYFTGQSKPYKTKMIVVNVPFDVAYQKSMGFINWLNKKRKVG